MADPIIRLGVKLDNPSNVRQVKDFINRSMGNVNVPVTINVSGAGGARATLSNINSINRSLGTLNKNASVSSAAFTKAFRDVDNFGRAISRSDNSLANMQKQLKAVNKEANDTSKRIKDFSQQISVATTRYAAFVAASATIIGFFNSIGEGINQAIKYQKELIRFQQVGGDTAETIKGLSKEIRTLSKDFGASSLELARTAVTLRQAGFAAKETQVALEALAKSALAPNFDRLEDTVEGLIATNSQFNISISKSEKALSQLNAVAGAYAVEASDLITGIRKLGGAFSSAGGSFEELLGLITAVRSTTRESADTIATGLRTILARTQRSATIEELERLGISLKANAREAKQFGIQVGSILPVYARFQKISEAAKNIPQSDPRFAQILELVGGIRQLSKTTPIILNFNKATEATALALRSTNTLTKDATTAQKALDTQLKELKESWLELFETIGGNQVLRSTLDAFIELSKSANELGKNLEPLVPILLAITARGGFTVGGGVLKNLVRGNIPLSVRTQTGFGGSGTTGSGVFVRRNRGGIVPGPSVNADIIDDTLDPGTFILKRDVTRKIIGFNRGGKVPVKLTPGETKIPPEAVSKFGLGNLELLNATSGKSLTPQLRERLLRYLNRIPAEQNRETKYALKHNFVAAGGNPVLVQGLNRGGQVRQRLNKGGITDEILALLLSQRQDALEFAQSRGAKGRPGIFGDDPISSYRQTIKSLESQFPNADIRGRIARAISRNIGEGANRVVNTQRESEENRNIRNQVREFSLIGLGRGSLRAKPIFPTDAVKPGFNPSIDNLQGLYGGGETNSGDRNNPVRRSIIAQGLTPELTRAAERILRYPDPRQFIRVLKKVSGLPQQEILQDIIARGEFYGKAGIKDAPKSATTSVENFFQAERGISAQQRLNILRKYIQVPKDFKIPSDAPDYSPSYLQNLDVARNQLEYIQTQTKLPISKILLRLARAGAISDPQGNRLFGNLDQQDRIPTPLRTLSAFLRGNVGSRRIDPLRAADAFGLDVNDIPFVPASSRGSNEIFRRLDDRNFRPIQPRFAQSRDQRESVAALTYNNLPGEPIPGSLNARDVPRYSVPTPLIPGGLGRSFGGTPPGSPPIALVSPDDFGDPIKSLNETMKRLTTQNEFFLRRETAGRSYRGSVPIIRSAPQPEQFPIIQSAVRSPISPLLVGVSGPSRARNLTRENELQRAVLAASSKLSPVLNNRSILGAEKTFKDLVDNNPLIQSIGISTPSALIKFGKRFGIAPPSSLKSPSAQEFKKFNNESLDDPLNAIYAQKILIAATEQDLRNRVGIENTDRGRQFIDNIRQSAKLRSFNFSPGGRVGPGAIIGLDQFGGTPGGIVSGYDPLDPNLSQRAKRFSTRFGNITFRGFTGSGFANGRRSRFASNLPNPRVEFSRAGSGRALIDDLIANSGGDIATINQLRKAKSFLGRDTSGKRNFKGASDLVSDLAKSNRKIFDRIQQLREESFSSFVDGQERFINDALRTAARDAGISRGELRGIDFANPGNFANTAKLLNRDGSIRSGFSSSVRGENLRGARGTVSTNGRRAYGAEVVDRAFQRDIELALKRKGLGNFTQFAPALAQRVTNANIDNITTSYVPKNRNTLGAAIGSERAFLGNLLRRGGFNRLGDFVGGVGASSSLGGAFVGRKNFSDTTTNLVNEQFAALAAGGGPSFLNRLGFGIGQSSVSTAINNKQFAQSRLRRPVTSILSGLSNRGAAGSIDTISRYGERVLSSLIKKNNTINFQSLSREDQYQFLKRRAERLGLKVNDINDLNSLVTAGEKVNELNNGRSRGFFGRASQSIRNFEQSRFGRGIQRAGIGLGGGATAALIGASFFAPERISRNQKGSVITSGLLSGVGTGAIAGGALGPFGAAAGALVGGLVGVTKSLQSFDKKLQSIDINRKINQFGTDLENILKRDNLDAGDITTVKDFVSTVESASKINFKDVKEQQDFLTQSFGARANELNTIAARIIQQPNINNVQDFATANGGTEIIRALSAINQQTLYETRNVIAKQIKQASSAKNVSDSFDKLSIDIDRATKFFNDLSFAIDSVQFNTINNARALELRTFSTGTPTARSLDIAGGIGSFREQGNADRFRRAASIFAGLDQSRTTIPGTSSGQKFLNELLDSQKAVQLLPNIIRGVTSNTLDPELLSNQLESALSAQGIGSGARQRLTEAFNAIPGEDLLEKAAKDFNGLVSELVDAAFPGVKILEESARKLETSLGTIINAFQERSRFDQQIRQYGNRFFENQDLLNRTANEFGGRSFSPQFRGIGRRQLSRLGINPTTSFFAGNTGLDFTLAQLANPLIQSQRELSGLGNQSFNPRAIFNRLQDIQGQARAVDQQLAGETDLGQILRLQDKFSLLTDQSDRLKLALENLSDASNLNAAAQEKLAAIEQERGGRLSFAERFIQANPFERQQIALSVQQANIASRVGLDQFNPIAQGNILNTLRSIGDVSTGVAGFTGNQLADNLIQRSTAGNFANNLLGGFRFDQLERGRQNVQGNIINNINIAREASRLLAQGVEAEQQAFFRQLRDNQKTFLSDLSNAITSSREENINQQIFSLRNNNREVSRGIGISTKLLNKGLDPTNIIKIANSEEFANFQNIRNELGALITSVGGLKNLDPKRDIIPQLSKLNLPVPISDIQKAISDSDVYQTVLAARRRSPKTVSPEVVNQAAFVATDRFLRGRVQNQFGVLTGAENELRTIGGTQQTIDFLKGANAGDINQVKELSNIIQANGGSIDALNSRFSESIGEINELNKQLGRLNTLLDDKNIKLVPNQNPPASPFILDPQFRASGGSIFRARGADTVPAMLKPGEFIMSKEATDRYRPTLQAMNNPIYRGSSGDLNNPMYFARGGFVGGRLRLPRNLRNQELVDNPLAIRDKIRRDNERNTALAYNPIILPRGEATRDLSQYRLDPSLVAGRSPREIVSDERLRSSFGPDALQNRRLAQQENQRSIASTVISNLNSFRESRSQRNAQLLSSIRENSPLAINTSPDGSQLTEGQQITLRRREERRRASRQQFNGGSSPHSLMAVPPNSQGFQSVPPTQDLNNTINQINEPLQNLVNATEVMKEHANQLKEFTEVMKDAKITVESTSRVEVVHNGIELMNAMRQAVKEELIRETTKVILDDLQKQSIDGV